MALFANLLNPREDRYYVTLMDGVEVIDILFEGTLNDCLAFESQFEGPCETVSAKLADSTL